MSDTPISDGPPPGDGAPADRRERRDIVSGAVMPEARLIRFAAGPDAGVTPDLLTLGKGVTAGYLPLSAVLATEEVYASFLGTPSSGRTFFHGHTYTGNPLACAAAIANLDLMAERGTVAGHAPTVIGNTCTPSCPYTCGIVPDTNNCRFAADTKNDCPVCG